MKDYELWLALNDPDDPIQYEIDNALRARDDAPSVPRLRPLGERPASDDDRA